MKHFNNPVPQRFTPVRLTAEDCRRVSLFLGSNNYQRFNTWQQIARCKACIEYSEHGPRHFKCAVTILLRQLPLALRNVGQGRSKKQAKRNALLRSVNDIMWRGLIGVGFKGQAWLQGIPELEADPRELEQQALDAQQIQRLAAVSAEIKASLQQGQVKKAICLVQRLCEIKDVDPVDLQPLWTIAVVKQNLYWANLIVQLLGNQVPEYPAPLLKLNKSIYELLRVKRLPTRNELDQFEQCSCLPQVSALIQGTPQVKFAPFELQLAEECAPPPLRKIARYQPKTAATVLGQLRNEEDFLQLDLLMPTQKLVDILRRKGSLFSRPEKAVGVPVPGQQLCQREQPKTVQLRLLQYLYQTLQFSANYQFKLQLSQFIVSQLVPAQGPGLSSLYIAHLLNVSFLDSAARIDQAVKLGLHPGQKLDLTSSLNKEGQQIFIIQRKNWNAALPCYCFIKRQGSIGIVIAQEYCQPSKLRIVGLDLRPGQITLTPLGCRIAGRETLNSLRALSSPPSIGVIQMPQGREWALGRTVSDLVKGKSHFVATATVQELAWVKGLAQTGGSYFVLGQVKGQFEVGVLLGWDQALLVGAARHCREGWVLLGDCVDCRGLGLTKGAGQHLGQKLLQGHPFLGSAREVRRVEAQSQCQPGLLRMLGGSGPGRPWPQLVGVGWPGESRAVFYHNPDSAVFESACLAFNVACSVLRAGFLAPEEVLIAASHSAAARLSSLDWPPSRPPRITTLRPTLVPCALLVLVLPDSTGSCAHSSGRALSLMRKATRGAVVVGDLARLSRQAQWGRVLRAGMGLGALMKGQIH